MKNINVDQLKNLLDEAEKSIDSSEKILKELLDAPVNEVTSLLEDIVFSIQLILQYRLSCQDALAVLLNFDQNLLYILGIQPQHSAKMNLDRLVYALGHDDLRYMLHSLSLLVNSLLKITNRYQKEHASFGLKANKGKYIKQNSLINGMQKLISQHNHFLSLIRKLEDDVKRLLEYPSVGPIFDHIAALRGPISQFHQAILHGIGQAKQLYEKVNRKQPINQRIDLLLKKSEELLNIMPSIYKPPQYTLGQASKISSEQLEQRAAAKRLRPFF